MFKRRFWAIILILVSILIGYFVYSTNNPDSNKKFKLGLDLNGGIELVYKADTSNLNSSDISSKMNSLKDLIEKRVNAFGVSEAIVQVESVDLLGDDSHEQLIVSLPGQTDIEGAIAQVGKTYVLEFKFLKKDLENSTSTDALTNESFESSGLTGTFLERATL